MTCCERHNGIQPCTANPPMSTCCTDCPDQPPNAFGSPEYIAKVREGLGPLRVLIDEHGFNKGAVMFLTGFSADEVDRLGGVPDE